ncbi:MAG: glycosyltransferase family 2 protein [Candidatus Omnitrophota bacterium]
MKKDISVSFVLPMYNERENILKTVDEVRTLAKDITDDYEIIIVDDASTDDSVKIAGNLAKEDNAVRLFCLNVNTKFGGAFAKGFKEATKDVILYVDSDMPVSKKDIKASFPLIRDADIVTGYSSVRKGDTPLRKFISGAYNFIVRMLFGLKVKDVNSGYKIVSRKIIEDIEFISRSPFVDVELFLHIKKKNGRVKQFPLVFRTRSGGKSYIARFPVILATFTDMIKVKIHSCVKQKKNL